MDSKQLVKFLKVLHGAGCSSAYWQRRIADVIEQIEGKPYARE